uniref:JmjC domain-containing protein n=1 Tax=Ciona savignyi TaxID=51511 RepID=H2ZD82_CIOSA
MPARTKWTDQYMMDNYGDLRVKLESKYEKDFKPEGDQGMGQDSIRRFLNTYIPYDKYMVSQLPDPLSKEVTVPQCILCGSFRERILEANIWMSSGNTKSLLHRDADNAFNCLLNGTKDWILIDPSHEEMLPVAVESGSPYGGFTLINVNKVDLIKFPAFKDVPWYYANLGCQLCVIIILINTPLNSGHWHQVRSYGAKNLAVSMLFSRNEFDPKGCPSEGLPPSELLSEVPMVWTYDGYEAQTMGNTDPFELKESLEQMCKTGEGRITGEMFEEEMLTGMEVEEDQYKGTVEFNSDEYEIPEENVEIMKQRAQAIMELIDPEHRGYYDCALLANMSVDTLKKISDIKDPDPANTDKYEFLHLHPKLIRNLILSSVELSKEIFMNEYRSHEGSTAGAQWIFDTLDSDNDGRCSQQEIKANMEKVLERYQDNLLADVAGHQANNIEKSRDEL